MTRQQKQQLLSPGRAASTKIIIPAAGLAAVLALYAPCAWGQDFSHDGYAPNGAYQLNVEVTPYAFLPHVGFTASGLGPRDRAGTSGSISGWQIVQSLHGAFFGDGLVRYGPYSAELNIIWVDVGGGQSVAVPKLGTSAHLNASASAVLVSPGVGYQVYRGEIALAPLAVDARVGFQYMSWSTSANTAANVLGGASASGDRVSPWLGIRADLFTMPNWRVRFVGDISGLGTNNGSWGWTTTLTLSYLVNNWFDVSAGLSAVGTSVSADRTDILGTHRSSLHAIAYGPTIGVGFRF